ncbi:hypothetical protein HYV70_02220 [Candidatus Uhrbacteria bacterium]|nr:hypothetical protein [Candidatus Uhrbacteria bacterium]
MNKRLEGAWFHDFEPITVVLRREKKEDFSCIATPVLFSGFPSSEEAGFGLRFKSFEQVEFPRDAFHSEDRGLYLCSNVSPHDLFAFWRACQLLPKCTFLDSGIVQLHLFDVTQRSPRFVEEYSKKTVNETLVGGQQNLDTIMQTPVPDWLVDKLIELWSVNGSSPFHHCVREEVRAGLLAWRKEFDTLGILSPKEFDRLNDLWEEVRPQYLPVMRQMVDVVGGWEVFYVHSDEKIALSKQREALLKLYEAGAHQKYGLYATAAAAFIASERVDEDLLETFTGYMIPPLYTARRYDRKENHYLHQTSAWVAKKERKGKPYNPDQVLMAREKIVEILQQYFPGLTHEQKIEKVLKERFGFDLKKNKSS